MGDKFSKHDGSGFVTFMGAESMWVPMVHHEYSDTATIGNPLRASREKSLKYEKRHFPNRAWKADMGRFGRESSSGYRLWPEREQES